MAAHLTVSPSVAVQPRHSATAEPGLVRWALTAAAIVFLLMFLVVPLIAVFAQALEKGLGAYLAVMGNSDVMASVRLTLFAAGIAVPLNVLFGIAAAWSIAKFDFVGKNVLLSFIDIPISVSPVISGMVFVLLFGAQGWFGPWLSANDIKIIFAVPGIVLATTFVTFPYVARELIPLMQAQGSEEEEAAVLLGAGGWQTFTRVTLPNIKWGLLYGIAICNARAMGEFGAVSVVSGRIRGSTNTMPLQAEILYNEYNFVGAFTVASLLTGLAVITLIAKTWLERRTQAAVDDASAPRAKAGPRA